MRTICIHTSGTAVERFGDEIVLINLARGNYYSLTQPAAIHIWEMLKSTPTPNQISNSLVAHFDVGQDTAAVAVEVFLGQLLAECLVFEGPQAETDESTVAASGTKQAFTAPVLNIYSDLQELIALDPVHNVDETFGWPERK